MEQREFKRKFIKPQIKSVSSHSDLKKLFSNTEITPKKQHINNRNQLGTFSPIRKVRDLKCRQIVYVEENNVLYEENMELIQRIKSLGRINGEEDSTVRKSERKMEKQIKRVNVKKRAGQHETIIKSRINFVSQNDSGQQTYRNQVSYLLKCIQQRQQTIDDLKQQLHIALSHKQSNNTQIHNIYKKQLQQKQQIIKTLTSQLRQSAISLSSPHNNTSQLFQIKKQNYKLRLRINQLTHQLAQYNQKRHQMQQIICDLYLDNQFRAQQSEMIFDIKQSCQRSRSKLKRVIKEQLH